METLQSLSEKLLLNKINQLEQEKLEILEKSKQIQAQFAEALSQIRKQLSDVKLELKFCISQNKALKEKLNYFQDNKIFQKLQAEQNKRYLISSDYQAVLKQRSVDIQIIQNLRNQNQELTFISKNLQKDLDSALQKAETNAKAAEKANESLNIVKKRSRQFFEKVSMRENELNSLEQALNQRNRKIIIQQNKHAHLAKKCKGIQSKYAQLQEAHKILQAKHNSKSSRLRSLRTWKTHQQNKINQYQKHVQNLLQTIENQSIYKQINQSLKQKKLPNSIQNKYLQVQIKLKSLSEKFTPLLRKNIELEQIISQLKEKIEEMRKKKKILKKQAETVPNSTQRAKFKLEESVLFSEELGSIETQTRRTFISS